VEGTETFPVEIQRIIANAAKNMTKDQTKAVIDQVAKSLAESGYTGEPQQDTYTELTLSDIAEVLKSVEKNESYEAARHFASHLDYGKLTEIAKAYVNGEDTNPDNDPNLMPTRFMLLYGMEDSKIKDINDHPDCDPQNPHQINLKNLRKALRMQGAQIAEEGTFDDEVYYAWHNYVIKIMRNLKAGFTHTVAEYEGLGDIARSYNLPSWKYLYQCNKDLIGNNPDLLKNGMELKIPQWDDTTGDEMITEKGADLSKYVGGLGWRYPWQSLSVSFIEDIKRGLLPDFDDERRFKLVTEETGETILNGTIKRCDELDVIIPDLVQVKSFVEGLTIK
ncbi:MAG TPA: LysM domain-containing protein, partial [Chitinispirillaceae bacterium]|nr:LysM domain-containing protein [Chitinispirillaceae bacterium]